MGWDGCLCDRFTTIDLAVGVYDMDAEYRIGALSPELSEIATTVETVFTMRTIFRGYQIGITMGMMYISDMPTIQHSTSTLASDEAVTLNGMIELLW